MEYMMHLFQSRPMTMNPLSEDKSLRTNSVKSFYTANVFRIQNRILEPVRT